MKLIPFIILFYHVVAIRGKLSISQSRNVPTERLQRAREWKILNKHKINCVSKYAENYSPFILTFVPTVIKMYDSLIHITKRIRKRKLTIYDESVKVFTSSSFGQEIFKMTVYLVIIHSVGSNYRQCMYLRSYLITIAKVGELPRVTNVIL